MKCNEINVPKSCCYIRFGKCSKKNYAGANDWLKTITGDLMIVDVDKKNRVIGIELLGEGKMCQTMVAKK